LLHFLSPKPNIAIYLATILQKITAQSNKNLWIAPVYQQAGFAWQALLAGESSHRREIMGGIFFSLFSPKSLI